MLCLIKLAKLQGISMSLQKSFSTPMLLASGIAGILGSGWLLGPLASVRIAGPAAILSWAIAGLLMMLVAATFVLLARGKPITGGTVRFFQITYGHFAGFSFSWIAWLAWVAVAPIETMALIQYSSNYFPGLMTLGTSPILTMQGVSLGIILMVLLTLVNNYGVNVYKRANIFLLVFKLLIPIVTVGLLLSTHFQSHNFTSAGGFMPYGWHSVFAALPLAGIIYAFIGFNPVIQLAAEVKNPKKAIPIAIFGALLVCIILYVLIQLAFIAALPSSMLVHGWHNLHFTGDHGPFIGLLVGFGLVFFVKFLYLDSCVSPVGTAMVQALATSRLTYAMSKNGYLPKCLMKINKFGSPYYALWFNCGLGILFFLPFPSWQHMVGFLVSCLVLGYVAGPMSLMASVVQSPKKFQPFSVKFIHSLSLVAFYICNLMIIWSGWEIVMKIFILFFSGYIVLGLMKWMKIGLQNITMDEVIRGSWAIVYIIGLTLISFFSSFGGGDIIHFGLDFFVIALFSAMVYGLAYMLMKYSINLLPEAIPRPC